jgi:hypothetical protein
VRFFSSFLLGVDDAVRESWKKVADEEWDRLVSAGWELKAAKSAPLSHARVLRYVSGPSTTSVSQLAGHPGPLSSGGPSTSGWGNRSNARGSPWM